MSEYIYNGLDRFRVMRPWFLNTHLLIFGLCAALLGTGCSLFENQDDSEARQQVRRALDALRTKFASEIRLALTSDDKTYLSAIHHSLARYQAALKAEVYNERPDLWQHDRLKKSIEQQYSEGRLTKSHYQGMLKRYQFVLDAYTVLKEAAWRPILTTAGDGGTRLDIYSAYRISKGQQSLLEFHLFLWGVEPDVGLSFGSLEIEYWAEEKPDRRIRSQRRRKGLPEDAPVLRPLGRTTGSARPDILDRTPHKTIAEFPSSVVIGRLTIPQVPKEAAYMQMNLAYTVRSGDVKARSDIQFPRLRIPDDWKNLGTTEWDAELEVSAEEMKPIDLSEAKTDRK